MALSDINEVIDRSIEERLYLTALSEGYTPNRDTFASDVPGFDAAIEAIILAKGFAVDIFGAASDDARDLKEVPRITYDNLAFQQGGLGSGNELLYIDNGPDFTSFKRAPRTAQLRFSLRLTSKTSEHDRVLHAIMTRSLRNQSYIPFYNDVTTNFLITYVYNVNVPDLKEGLIEKIYLYEAHDLWEDDFTEIQTSVAKINEINVAEDQTDDASSLKTRIIKLT